MKVTTIIDRDKDNVLEAAEVRKKIHDSMKQEVEWDPVIATEKSLNSDDALYVSRSRRNNTDFFLAIGDDKLVHDSMDGLIYSNTKFGIIPFGSRNNIYDKLKGKKNFSLSVGGINRTIFVDKMNMGINLQKESKYYNAHKFKRLFRKGSYTPFKTNFKLDGHSITDESDNIFFLQIENNIEERCFDIYLIRNIDENSLYKIFDLMNKCSLKEIPYVEHFGGMFVDINSKDELEYSYDGIKDKDKDIKIEMKRDAINFINTDKVIEEISKKSR